MTLTNLYRIFLSCSSVCTDSRHCPEGALFVALKGASFNGNAFAAQALQQGCAYALVDEAAYAPAEDHRYILVPDALQALQELARHHRRQLGTRLIGITGTNGKTTTKELIASVLSQTYRILYTEGNLNNHIGVPLTLLRLKPEHQLAVVEMGANHPGEIAQLCNIAEPDYGLITNVGKAHLEGFGSFQGVVRTKGELYDFLRQRPGGTLFLHQDNPHLTTLAAGLRNITYGSQAGANICGRVVANNPFLALEWSEAETPRVLRIQTQLIGAYNLPNALAAIAIGRYFGVPAQQVDEALAAYTPRNNRSQLTQTVDNTLIVDAYNANPTSMMAALENFRLIEAPHKMVILGDMRELGSESAAEHQQIADYLTTHSCGEVRLVGREFTAARHSFPTYADVGELIASLREEKPRGYTILIKGSNGIRLSTAVDFL